MRRRKWCLSSHHSVQPNGETPSLTWKTKHLFWTYFRSEQLHRCSHLLSGPLMKGCPLCFVCSCMQFDCHIALLTTLYFKRLHSLQLISQESSIIPAINALCKVRWSIKMSDSCWAASAEVQQAEANHTYQKTAAISLLNAHVAIFVLYYLNLPGDITRTYWDFKFSYHFKHQVLECTHSSDDRYLDGRIGWDQQFSKTLN